MISDFVARKIRQRVKNPEVAEKLIPRNHGFGTRRLPLETRYYEFYNQDTVELVDITQTPRGRHTTPDPRPNGAQYQFGINISPTGPHRTTASSTRIPRPAPRATVPSMK